LRVLSNEQVLPAWQRQEVVRVPRQSESAAMMRPLELGNPMSVLPDAVQESLRSGQAVELRDIIPVPAR
jgi:hypothetical protein